MLEYLEVSPTNWARAQFALTAMYHWIFVPLTLGLSFLCAFFETFYLKTGKEEWKSLTRFWMTLFGINFAIGVATGLILEFEFGANWSNYSWMVGDIFGAPLAIEGLFAFFLEATFFAVMFFGWRRVSPKFHLFSTWMVAIGSNLSALWILVANGWMQSPVGMVFNPDTARFEMENFKAVILSPVAISKFCHSTSSGFVLASLFVIAISSWYLIMRRHQDMAKRSILVASVFGLLASGLVGLTGDEAAYSAARHQPMKLAAFEGLYNGQKSAPLVTMGLLSGRKEPRDGQEPFIVSMHIDGLLSLLANREVGSFVPGIEDLLYGNEKFGVMGIDEKIVRGRQALTQLSRYKVARQADNEAEAEEALSAFRQDQEFMGFGYLRTPVEAVPPVPLTFYSFHLMVVLGSLFPLIFLLFLIFTAKDMIENHIWLPIIGIISFFLAHAAGQAGWIVAEVGRQPWTIQDLLPVSVANTRINPGSIKMTFFMFLVLFTILLIAEIRIMLSQIKKGPEEV